MTRLQSRRQHLDFAASYPSPDLQGSTMTLFTTKIQKRRSGALVRIISSVLAILALCAGATLFIPRQQTAADEEKVCYHFRSVNAALDCDGKSIADLQDYLTSPERTARYEAIVTQAGKLIAEGLHLGVFGKPYRYTSESRALSFDDTGEGFITTFSPYSAPPRTPGGISVSTHAKVWWNEGATIGNQPITSVEIANKDASVDTYISIFGMSEDEQFWQSSMVIDGVMVTNAAGLQLKHWAAQELSIPADNRVPGSLAAFKELDDRVLTQLDANMTSWFGPDWQSK